ncbi:MAG: glycerophosphodiester phosphodiesterase [Planctomycetes bacterium]|nr:glycerophosphodiester phosphodiesterase [Planctomycetota bacterium]
MPAPKLVAHRGYARRFPENTLAAVEGAIHAGAHFVEIDVQLTSDGYPVLFHDRTTERMCGEPGSIGERTLAQVRELSCHEPGTFGAQFQSEGIASLGAFAQLLRKHPQVRAFVEVKRAALERFGNERVLERVLHAIEPARHQCSLISFSLPFLLHTRAAHPIALGAVFDAWKERDQPAVRELRPEFVFCDVEGLPARGALAHDGARLVIYEVADSKLAIALGERGVEFVETFEIGAMRAALGPDPA